MAIWRGAGGSGDATTDAANEASVASTKAAEAEASATAAASSATSAATSATSASSSASSASTDASAAAASALAAAASETAAAASELNAAASEAAAGISESNAATSETNAQTAQTAAETAQTAAEAAQALTEAAKDSTLAAFDSFDDRYLGAKASDPTTDNDGDPLQSGMLYFNTVSGVMNVYDGSAWVAAYVSAAGVLIAANNLSDLTSTTTARSNLGVVIGTDVQAHSAVLDATTASYTTAEETKLAGIETGATADQTASEIMTAIQTVDGTGSGLDADLLDGIDSTGFATAAQGTLADSATQPGDNVSDLTNDAGYLTTIDLTAESIDELSDVDTSTVAPTEGQALLWDSTDGEWQPGDVASSTAAKIIDADGDTQIQTEESADEDILRFDTAGVERATLAGALDLTDDGGAFIHSQTQAGTYTINSGKGTLFAGPITITGTVTNAGTMVVI